MLTFISFGSGSCGNCYYLGTETESIIIDAGVGIRRLKKCMTDYGVKKENIKAILITHDHSDHIKAVGLLSSELGIPVYTTAPIHQGIYRNYTVVQKVPLDKQVSILQEQPFQVGSFHITAFPIPHDSTENVGYHIRLDDTTFSMMTDVGSVTENVARHIAGSRYVVIEANYDVDMLRTGRYPDILKERIACGTGHLSNMQTAQALADNLHPGLRHVWLCHLSEENNHPELARKTVETHLRTYGIVAGVDFQLDVLKRKVATGPFCLE